MDAFKEADVRLYNSVIEGVLRTFFKGAPAAESFSRMGEARRDGGDAATRCSEAQEVIKGLQNFEASYVSKRYDVLEDVLRLKPGLSTGIAVKANVYPKLGTVGQQEEVDMSAYIDLVERLLHKAVDPESGFRFETLSRVLRGSLKLDVYEWPKVHGEPSQLKTRLIFAGCIVRAGVMRSLIQKSFEFAIQAPLDPFKPLKNAFTVVPIEGWQVGLCLVNAQNVTGSIMTFLAAGAEEARRELNALDLVAGDSLYLRLPWNDETRAECVKERVSTYARRYFGSEASAKEAEMLGALGFLCAQDGDAPPARAVPGAKKTTAKKPEPKSKGRKTDRKTKQGTS